MGNYKNKAEYEQRVLKFRELLLVKDFNIACKESKISITSGNLLIKKEGLYCKRRNLGNCNDSYFSTIDNEEKAYLLGFFLADGSIDSKSNRMQVNNSVDDKEIILKFQELICPNMKLNHKENPHKKDACGIRWSSLEMKKDLEKYNIKPNKTYDFEFEFPFETIPEYLQRHFIRGFFDGDGHISKKGHFEFITTSKPFANQLMMLIETLFDVERRPREKKTKNVVEYMFYFFANGERKSFLTKIYNWFYTDCTIFLNRKKSKFEFYLNTEVSSEITKGSETP